MRRGVASASASQLSLGLMPPGQDVLAALLDASARTWRLSDGRGSLARGTASGAATRRGHALLSAPAVGPRAEWPAVSLLRFDDRVTPEGGAALELTPGFALAARGDGPPAVHARAGVLSVLESFTELPWPRWRFRGDGWRLEREYRLIEGHAALLASWRLLEGGPLRLHVGPLLVARSLEGLQAETPEFRGATTGIPGRVRCGTLEGYAPLTVWHGGAFMPARAWHRAIAYPCDVHVEAGDPDRGAATPYEDAFLPGWVQMVLAEPGAALHLAASPEEGLFRSLASEMRLGTPPARTLAECLAMLDLAEGDRRARWHDAARTGAEHTLRLAARARAARTAEPGVAVEEVTPPSLGERDGTLVARLAARLHDALHERADRTSVLTDPEHATEYGPDALRVAAGLVTLREFDRARDVARGYIAYLDEGLAPESFDAAGMPHYGSPESSLWLVHVVDLLARRDDETDRTREFLRDGAYPTLEGVLHHLRSGSRHGVHCDRDGLLWAGEGDTARARADLNALWYHALVAMSQLGKLAGRRESAAFYLAWARELQRVFVERFWDEEAGALFDSVAADGTALRALSPAQLYAVSLPPMMLPLEHAVRLVATVSRELLATRGLHPRPGDGAPDPAWLGPWAAATARAHGRDAASTHHVRTVLERWVELGEADAREITARGAADLLRAFVEELDHAPSGEPVVSSPRPADLSGFASPD